MAGQEETCMFELPAHIGTEHPNLLWIAVAGLLSFGAGLGVALFNRGADTEQTPVPEPEEE